MRKRVGRGKNEWGDAKTGGERVENELVSGQKGSMALENVSGGLENG